MEDNIEMVQEKSWEEFRNFGLLWWVNSMLHIMGWALVYDKDTKNVYPARVKFRGFSEDSTKAGYIKVSQYMADNAAELLEESKN